MNAREQKSQQWTLAGAADQVSIRRLKSIQGAREARKTGTLCKHMKQDRYFAPYKFTLNGSVSMTWKHQINRGKFQAYSTGKREAKTSQKQNLSSGTIKITISKWDDTKLRSFCPSKEIVSNVKRQPIEWQKRFTNYQDPWRAPEIPLHERYSQGMAKDMNRHFPRNEM